MSEERVCPVCRTPVTPGSQFCGACGTPLPTGGVPATHGAPLPSSRGAPMKTMMGGPAFTPPAAPVAPVPVAQPQPAPAPAPAPKRQNATMMGMPGLFAGAGPAPGQLPTIPAAPQPAQPVPPQPVAPQPVAPQPAAPTPAVPLSPQTHRTMLGLPAAAMQQAIADAKAAQAQPAAAPAKVSPALAPQTHRTMLGVAAPTAAEIAAVVAAAPAPAASVQQPVQAPYGSGATPSEDDIQLPTVGPKPSRALLIIVLLVALVAVLGVSAVGLVLALRGGSGPNVQVSVVTGPAGEQLAVDVPGAPVGTKARYGGLELPLVSGRATFPLASSALHVGDNDVAVTIVAPNGDASARNVKLTVEFRVRPDLTTLSAASNGPPGLDVVVDARPGAVATVDGQPVPLDAHGHGTHHLAFDPASAHDGAVEVNARYAVTPAGGRATDGTLHARIPVTTIQIDRPGLRLVTDAAQVDIAGVVDPAAHLTLDDVPLEVHAGHFLTHYLLDHEGTFAPRLVATAPGKAPRVVTLDLRRVHDLAAEAASFHPDPQLTYARIQTAPGTFRGQRVAIVGRVYNVSIDAGASVVQILARDCPGTQRCALWITYPAATDVTVNQWVRVLGTIAGEQQFRSEAGDVRTVPRIDAEFLLPQAGP